MRKETIVLGGGCFWCTEAVFQMLRGITSVTPGYAGGTKPNPTYEEICAGGTGHAEVVQIEYTPDIIPIDTILTVFFASHDPTQVNRQGNDIGTQYRSVIFYTTEEQKLLCDKCIADINASNETGAPVATQVEPLDAFYPAENYHQNYYKNNPSQGYCQVVINPKLDKVKKKFAHVLNSLKSMEINEENLKQKLTPEQYRVLREKGTEKPFTGEYVHKTADGMYTCKVCNNPLFTSDAQFDSGTGWPSFDKAIEGSVTYQDDHGATEIICAKCQSHLGHVFDDGPTKTGKRYCINSVCLDLTKNGNR